MADRKPTVLNPAGYQENLQDTDNLVVEAAPTADNHAVNKGYADTEIAAAGKWNETGGALIPKQVSNDVVVGGSTGDPKIKFTAASGDIDLDGTITSNIGGDTNAFVIKSANGQKIVSQYYKDAADGAAIILGDVNGTAGVTLYGSTGSGIFTGNVTAASFTGPVTGDITGNITGNINGNVNGDVTGNLTGDVTGDVTGNLTGDVTGDVTGNLTGNVDGNVTGDVTGDLTGDVTGNLTGNVNGNVTGDLTGDVTGNADTATKLKTARNINGTAFDGTANITTAKWGTARNLNGVSVDGSEDKTLEPYVERDDGSDAARYLAFVDNSSPGYKRLNMDLNLNYNPSTNILNTSISGSAGTIDGLDSTQFLRSDVDDSASGNLTFNGRVLIRGNIDISDNQNLDFGSSDDTRFTYNPDDWLYCNFRTGNGILFQDNGSSKMALEDSGVFRPTTNNTGNIGTSSFYWNDAYLQNLNVASTLNVRGVIDLADNDIIRFGSGDDAEFFTNGSHFYLDLNGGIGNFYIRDGETTRFTFNDNGAFTCTGKLTAGNFDLESLPTLP